MIRDIRYPGVLVTIIIISIIRINTKYIQYLNLELKVRDKVARGPRARAGTKLLGGQGQGQGQNCSGFKGKYKIAQGPRARAGTKLIGVQGQGQRQN